ncbi:Clp protease N-terminal domain-containing protein [Amycolatopsis sp. NPDC059657]|uniref:Clp protease N-terminal domain-containing protein n=1 Tax=Amycolatopsis sp. NPDC059657 TaxID=3346899 RepID=UPI00366F49CD
MFHKFTESARKVVAGAQDETRKLGHQRIGNEHLFLAALAHYELGIDIDEARQVVRRLAPADEEPAQGHVPFSTEAKGVLEQGLYEATGTGHKLISGGHLLLATIADPGTVASRALGELNVPVADFRDRVIATTLGD